MRESEQYLELIRGDPLLRATPASYKNVAGSTVGKDVLDYGCGYGWGSHLLSCHYRRITVCDPDQEHIEFASRVFSRRNIHFISKKACLSRKYYDLICLSMILHNIRDCEDTLTHLPGYSNPGEMIMFSYKSTYHALVLVLDQWVCDYDFTLACSSQNYLSDEESVEERCYYKNRDEEWLYALRTMCMHS